MKNSSSLKTKISMLIIIFTVLAAILVGAVSIYNSLTVTKENAERELISTSENLGKDINIILSCIETGVNTFADAAINEIQDLDRFSTEAAYVDNVTANLEQIAFNCATNVTGTMDYYIRYSPELAYPTSGLFYGRENPSSPFIPIPCTDFSTFDKNDSAHVGWYYIPIENHKPTWMNPYYNANINVYMISYIVPLFAKDGTALGIVGMDIDFNTIQKKIHEAKIYDTGYAILVNTNNEIIASKNDELGKKLVDIDKRLADFVTNKKCSSIIEYEKNGVSYVAGYTVLQNGMRYIMTVPKSEVNATSRDLVMYIALGMLLTICIGAFAAEIFTRPLVNPLKKLEEKTLLMANGDLTVKNEVTTNDEIGNVSTAFNEMTSQLREVISRIYTASQQVASGSKNISESGTLLANGAATQASSVEELSASIAEISLQTAHTAKSSNEANDLTHTAMNMALVGNERMEEMLAAMEEINTSSKNISKIIKVIDEIAFQTNILALNAAVEAARAGQHGKGFAVVAEEVRNLAARSAKAAKETTDIIEGSISKVNSGTALANETANALRQIKDGVAKVSSFVNEIAEASQKQSIALDMLNKGVLEVSTVVQANSSTAEESAAASQELSAQAKLLQDAIKKFKI